MQVTIAKHFLTNLRQTIQQTSWVFLPATFKKESYYLILDINFTDALLLYQILTPRIILYRMV